MNPPPIKEDFVNPFAGEGSAEQSTANVPEPAIDCGVSPLQHNIPHERNSDASTSDQHDEVSNSRTSGDAAEVDIPEDESAKLEKAETEATVLDESTGVVENLRTVAHRFHLDSIRATGPSRLFNPTNIHMKIRFRSDTADDDHQLQQAKELALQWRSRDNRKGRNSVAVPSIHTPDDTTFLPVRYTPRVRTTLKRIGNILWGMLFTFPYWDMAFWSGWSYTIGSALFVVDGVMAWGPVAYGDSWGVPEYGDTYVGPLSFFIGAMFYQVGAVMAYLEAVNDGSFHGAGMRRLLEGHEEDQKKMLDDKIHGFFSHIAHRHQDDEEETAIVDPEAGWRTKEARHLRPGSIYPTGKAPAPRRGAVDLGGDENDSSAYLTWRWYTSWHALRTHHIHEIGWLACTIQLFGVTLYGVTAIVVLPGVLSSLAWWQKVAAFWVPQAVAASCFLIASLMFMFETQEKWWKPEPKILGWWIGVWASIGSVGFIVIAAFGLRSNTETWAEYQSDLATIWGSAAYLISSWLQWYEALNKNEVEELFNEPGKMKSHQVHPI